MRSVFCEGPLWDPEFWTDQPPVLTRCFESTVLVYFPSLIILVGGVANLYLQGTWPERRLPKTILYFFKLLASIVLIAMHSWGLYLVVNSTSSTLSDLIAEVLRALNFLVAFFTIVADRRRGVGNSIFLSCFWFVTIVCDCSIFYRYMLSAFGPSDLNMPTPETSEYVLWSVSFTTVCLQFVLSSFTESSSHIKGRNPAYSASLLSHAFLSFFTGLVVAGYKKPLNIDDLTAPLDSMESFYCYRQWKKTVDGFQAIGQKVGLVRSLVTTYWKGIVLGWFLQFLYVVIKLSSFLLLNLLILYMSNDEPQWKGIAYSVAILLIFIFSAIFVRWSDVVFVTLGLKVKAILISAIYRKSLRITGTHLGKYTVGELVNLLSVDADKINQFSVFVGFMFACPLFIGISTALLWQFLGPTCLAGIAIIIIMMPVTGAVGSVAKKVQEKQMGRKDSRLKYISEILTSIKIIKFYAWEPPFMERVKKVRFEENVLLKKFAYLTATLRFFWSVTPFLVSLFAFLAYLLVNDFTMIQANVAFVSLSLFNSMRFSLAAIPDIISNAIQTLVSVRRIEAFLDAEELGENFIGNHPPPGKDVQWEDATFSWSADTEGEPVLCDISIGANKGQLVAVVGPVGSGKSSLLSSLLGDLKLLKGKVDVLGSLAYVPQQAWIQNATIKDNILFVKEYSGSRYREVLDKCCLKPDMDILPDGEQTEVGEKGVNLSGGQKQRISLARAVYQDKDIYLLDDPLSAVDAHVGAALFKDIIGNQGMLQQKTRVFVTNMLSVLPEVDSIIVMKGGAIVEQGSYRELVDRPGVFSDFLKEHTKERGESHEEDDEEESSQKPSKYMRSKSMMSEKSEQGKTAKKLISEEEMQTGSVDLSVYNSYISKIGWPLCILITLGFLGARVFDIYSGIWLSEWSLDDPGHKPENYYQRNKRIIVYALLGLLYGVFSFLGTAALLSGTITAARKLHNMMLHSILRAPMSFFDTTPLGRLLNRFGKDIDQLDMQLPAMTNLFLDLLFQIIGFMVLISIYAPLFLIIAIPNLVLYVIFQRVYMRTLRQVKRLEAVTRSPVYNHFSETLNGLSSIRAYGVGDNFTRKSDEKVDVSQNCTYLLLIGKNWLGARLDTISNILVVATNILLVAQKGSIDPGIAGFLASYSMAVSFAFIFIVQYSAEVESAIVASERVEEYSKVTPEADWVVEPRPSRKWPQNGTVRFEKYSTRYREGLELVLKKIDLSINAGEKIGIIGRTGAGKSSLTLSLFRIIEAAEGKLKIDDLDISRIGLHDLRSRLTIIPQDPVIFSGSLRLNLDPNSVYSDDKLWVALEKAHVKSQFSEGLEFEISEGGNNLSVGQRQLICLARAILSKKKILVMDEATAAVDLETDGLIQTTIREDFADCTIITIAHRLNTIMDSDRVVVMSQGEVIEQGTPQDLLKDTSSQFYAMAKEAGLVQDHSKEA